MSRLEQIVIEHNDIKKKENQEAASKMLESTLSKMFDLLTPEIKEEFNFRNNYTVTNEDDVVRMHVKLHGSIIIEGLFVTILFERDFDWKEHYFFSANLTSLAEKNKYTKLYESRKFNLLKGKPELKEDMNVYAGKFLRYTRNYIKDVRERLVEKYSKIDLTTCSSRNLKGLLEEVGLCAFLKERERAEYKDKYNAYILQMEEKEESERKINTENRASIKSHVDAAKKLEVAHLDFLMQKIVELRKKYAQPFTLYKCYFFPPNLKASDLFVRNEDRDEEGNYESIEQTAITINEPIIGEYVKAVRYYGEIYDLKIMGPISHIEKIYITPDNWENPNHAFCLKRLEVKSMRYLHHTYTIAVNPMEAEKIQKELDEIIIKPFDVNKYLESCGLKRNQYGDWYFGN